VQRGWPAFKREWRAVSSADEPPIPIRLSIDYQKAANSWVLAKKIRRPYQFIVESKDKGFFTPFI
jgi:hypothetical protein